MFRVRTLDIISPKGIQEFPKGLYEIDSRVSNPDAIIVRSSNIHKVELSKSLKTSIPGIKKMTGYFLQTMAKDKGCYGIVFFMIVIVTNPLELIAA